MSGSPSSGQPAAPRILDLQGCPVGTRATIIGIVDQPGLQTPVRRLAELGLRAGAVIEAGQRTSGGGRVVSVDGSSLALGAPLLPLVQVSAS